MQCPLIAALVCRLHAVPCCPATDHLLTTPPLLQCAPANCATPLADACAGCDICDNGYSKSGTVCNVCPVIDNCDTYTENLCTCATCKAGFEGDACTPVS